MPSKKKAEAEATPEEPKPSPDTVKVKVMIGTLATETGLYSKGDVFEVSRKRAEAFDKTSVQIME
jgi:hypothetical protein